jgi:thiamine pyrophosphokinase
MARMSQTLLRHIAACNNLPSPAGLLPFRLGEAQVGWMAPEAARALTFHPGLAHFDGGGVSLPARYRTPAARSEALARLAACLAERGFGRLRGEMFDVRAEAEGPVLATLDRGAVPAFGVIGQGVHLNGLVRRADGLHVWVGIRARDKAVAPGQLDNLVAGGIPAGLDPETTLLKEAGEEASLPESLARQARRVGRISYVLVNAEGLRRDVLHCFDLDLPEDFTPRPNDDEVERFELWPAARLLEAVRHADSVKFNVNLVLIDLFLREGLVAGAEAAELRAGLQQGP